MNDRIPEDDSRRRRFSGAPLSRQDVGTERVNKAGVGVVRSSRRFELLKQLAEVSAELDQLFLTLRSVSLDEVRARSYLAKPGSNRTLGRASLSRALEKRLGVSRRLDADCRRVDQMLSEIDRSTAMDRINGRNRLLRDLKPDWVD